MQELFQTITVGQVHLDRRARAQLAGFKLTFNEPLDPGSATILTNYTVLEYHREGRSLAAQSIRFRAAYDSSSSSVTLMLVGRHSFLEGGRLILHGLLANSATGLSNGTTTFTILRGARGVT